MKKILLIPAALLLVGGAAAGTFILLVNTALADISSDISFEDVRAAHQTNLIKQRTFDSGPLPKLSHPDLVHTTYTGPLGEMGAIASRIDESGIKKPAVVWDTGGFGGLWEGIDTYGEIRNDQGIASFLDKGIVVFLPTMRGEHENPGNFECFYGEIDDLAAALEHVAARPDVDPERIFLMGHSTGGTNVLLASMRSDIPAGVVCFGGAPDMKSIAADGNGYGKEPYNLRDKKEVRLRSPIVFTSYIKVPVLYIEGDDSFYVGDAKRMQRIAEDEGIPFRAAIVPLQDHFSVLRPTKNMLAKRIDEGATTLPTPDEVLKEIRSYYDSPNTQLLINIEAGETKLIEHFLDSGGDPNTLDDEGIPLIALAAQFNDDPRVITALADAGADMEWTSDIGGTPLIYASIQNANAIPALLEAGADINAPDHNGSTPLMYALANQTNPVLIQSMIDAGAEINTRDIDGYTPLHYAASNTNNPQLITILIENGADLHARNGRDQTPLMSAAEFNPYNQTIQALISAGADINTQTELGITALMYASFYNNNPRVVDALLDAGADATLEDEDGNTAPVLARSNGALTDTPTLTRLIEAGN